MKCRECGSRTTVKTSKKNLGKCSRCKKLENQIVKEIKKISWSGK